jgi:uncharacterized membrane protein
MMALIGAWSLALASVFFVVGAYPVAGFLGGEILLLYICFKRVIRSRSGRTHVRVTSRAVEIDYVDDAERVRSKRIPAPLRSVEIIDAGRAGVLRIRGPNDEAAIGDCLTDSERRDLARRLRLALREATRQVSY